MKNPVDTNNLSPFASNVKTGRYHTVDGSIRTLADTPLTSNRIRRSYKVNPPETGYIRYSVPNATAILDQTYWEPGEISVFPRHIYRREPFSNLAPSLEAPRDANYLYAYAPPGEYCKERDVHTITPSRFGYDRFPQTTEYGVGTQSRGYIEPGYCHECANDTPKGVAPERFYTAYHLRSTPTELRKMTGQQPATCHGRTL